MFSKTNEHSNFSTFVPSIILTTVYFEGDKFWEIWHFDSHSPNQNPPFCTITRMLNGTWPQIHQIKTCQSPKF